MNLVYPIVGSTFLILLIVIFLVWKKFRAVNKSTEITDDQELDAFDQPEEEEGGYERMKNSNLKNILDNKRHSFAVLDETKNTEEVNKILKQNTNFDVVLPADKFADGS